MAAKKAKSERRGVSQGKCEASGRIVLVGTYRGDQLTQWRGWYCYPVGNGECGTGNGRYPPAEGCPRSGCPSRGARTPAAPQSPANLSTLQPFNLSALQRVNELWLFQGTKDERRYKAEFVGIKTREELIRDYGYLAWECDDLAAKNAKTAKNGRARTPAAPNPHGTHYALFKTQLLYRHKGEVPGDAERVIIRTKDFARSPKIARQLKAYLESPDRSDPDLAKRLPEIITRLRPDQLRVCEAAVQMDLLQWESAVGMSPLLGKIESIVMSIGEFGRAYSLSSSDAYVYLKKYKGLAYLEDCHEPLSCLPMESLVDDLAQVCRNNGGKLV